MSSHIYGQDIKSECILIRHRFGYVTDKLQPHIMSSLLIRVIGLILFAKQMRCLLRIEGDPVILKAYDDLIINIGNTDIYAVFFVIPETMLDDITRKFLGTQRSAIPAPPGNTMVFAETPNVCRQVDDFFHIVDRDIYPVFIRHSEVFSKAQKILKVCNRFLIIIESEKYNKKRAENAP